MYSFNKHDCIFISLKAMGATITNIYETEKIRKLVKGLEWSLVSEIGFVLMFKMRYAY